MHRDVKPANVLIAAASALHVYLTDFGLTKRTSSQSGITKTGLFVGTIDYAAPEQIKGWPVDARADVYALGCVLFELVSGQPPFRRENEYATMYAHTSEPPPALSSVAAGVSPALDAVVARALAKEPDGRYPSAGDFARAVSAAVVGQAPSPSRERDGGDRRRRHPPAPAPPPTVVAQPPHPVYSYGLEPSTAVLPPDPPPARRSPWPAVIAVVVALLVPAECAAALLLEGGDKESAASTPVADTSGADASGADASPARTVREGVTQIAAVLDLSQRGRTSRSRASTAPRSPTA